MWSGVSKSGSPISRWTISRPCRSSSRARARTLNAVSVPRRSRLSARPGRSSCALASTGNQYTTRRSRCTASTPAGAPRDLLGGRVGDALRERHAVRPDELDGISRLEAALAADDADGEQAPALVDDGPPRAVVDVERAATAPSRSEARACRRKARDSAPWKRVPRGSPARIGSSTAVGRAARR